MGRVELRSGPEVRGVEETFKTEFGVGEILRKWSRRTPGEGTSFVPDFGQKRRCKSCQNKCRCEDVWSVTRAVCRPRITYEWFTYSFGYRS